MPVVVVTGARQTGKTTLVRDLFHDRTRRYFTLDRMEILEHAKTNPDSLLEELPITLDEVQRETGILLAIKRKAVELHPVEHHARRIGDGIKNYISTRS